MKVRRLNDAGMDRMEGFLVSVSSGVQQAVPDILEDPMFSEEVDGAGDLERQPLTTRIETARLLDEVLSACDQELVKRDPGLWAWLSLFFFESLCKKDRSGRWAPKALARWIPDMSDYKRYYRHPLVGPYLIHQSFREDPSVAMSLLYGPVDIQSEIVEQLASRQEIVTNPAIVGTATRLYIDAEGQPKRGSRGQGPGSPRRLVNLVQQFDRTYDLYDMTMDDLMALLPAEFDRYRA